ncbi:hypothetical protein VZT92_026547 [Zoarces viviparus]|uniref:Uncharacterized protein n=1 Tax=Zoarces viviparus TaxID=48416 RepID=A0AAW1E0F0_ZOAVI
MARAATSRLRLSLSLSSLLFRPPQNQPVAVAATPTTTTTTMEWGITADLVEPQWAQIADPSAPGANNFLGRAATTDGHVHSVSRSQLWRFLHKSAADNTETVAPYYWGQDRLLTPMVVRHRSFLRPHQPDAVGVAMLGTRGLWSVELPRPPRPTMSNRYTPFKLRGAPENANFDEGPEIEVHATEPPPGFVPGEGPYQAEPVLIGVLPPARLTALALTAALPVEEENARWYATKAGLAFPPLDDHGRRGQRDPPAPPAHRVPPLPPAPQPPHQPLVPRHAQLVARGRRRQPGFAVPLGRRPGIWRRRVPPGLPLGRPDRPPGGAGAAGGHGGRRVGISRPLGADQPRAGAGGGGSGCR